MVHFCTRIDTTHSILFLKFYEFKEMEAKIKKTDLIEPFSMEYCLESEGKREKLR